MARGPAQYQRAANGRKTRARPGPAGDPQAREQPAAYQR